jgi:phage/plasmid-associated DNA primase
MTTEEHRVDVEAEPNGRRPRPRPRQARIKPNAILERLLEDGWRFATSGDALFTYVDGIYVPGTKALRRHLSERLGSQWEMTRVNSVIQLAKDISDDLWLMPSTTHINLKSGLYNRETGQLDPHTPEYLSPVQLPITYDPTAECPKLDQFLEDVCPKNSGPLAYEILGYLATPDTWLKRAFFLQGPKHSGKSTFCELIGLFLGHQNVTAHTLQHLTSNRFGLATLYGKLANVFPDLPPTRVEDSSIFKMITGNDHLVSAERKYESPFQFWMHCRLLFSANEFPQSADQSETYLGRWLVLLFPNRT